MLELQSKPVWPKFLGALLWRGWVLVTGPSSDIVSNGDTNRLGRVVDVSERELEDVLYELYPLPSLIDLCLLQNLAKTRGLELNLQKLFAHYNLREHLYVERLSEQLFIAPTEFQNWCHQKMVSAGDLAPFRAIEQQQGIEALAPYLRQLALFQPSRNEGVRVLEWLVDLQLGAKLNDDFAQQLNAAAANWGDWSKQIQRLRYPRSSQREVSAEEIIQTLPWPKRSQAKLIRRGDMAGVELKLFIHSAADVRSQIQNLNSVANELEAKDMKSF